MFELTSSLLNPKGLYEIEYAYYSAFKCILYIQPTWSSVYGHGLAMRKHMSSNPAASHRDLNFPGDSLVRAGERPK